jgi:ribosome-binding factor A
LAIALYDQISIVGFLSREISSVLKWTKEPRFTFKQDKTYMFKAIYNGKN